MTAPPPADLTVTLRCNNRCSFCPRTTLRHVAAGDDLDDRLRALRSRSRRVVLTGGEVTVLSDVVDLVRRCRNLGFEEVGIITNGRALSAPGRVDQLVDAGLTEACVTVYDLRAEVHDGLTGVEGSLDETLAGLDQLLAVGSLPVRVNTMLCARNADGLASLLEGLTERGVGEFLVGDAVMSEAFDEPVAYRDLARLAQTLAAHPRLRRAHVVWRGFPLCVLRPLPGVVSEPQDVDTASVEGDDLDAYFTEFASNFAHTEACQGCALRDRCPGPQIRYVDRFGAGEFRPLGRPAAPRGAPGLEAWREPARLAVTPTSACQMRCRYCKVELGRAHAAPGILDRAVDLLLTSDRRRLELQFFGGEPLLRRDEVARTMARARRLAAQLGKQLQFTVTTNGLLLDDEMLELLREHDARVLFSMDGPPSAMARNRPLANGTDASAVVEASLLRLVASGVPHFVNIVVSPDDADELADRVRYVAELGVRTVQLCYAAGPGWDRDARDRFCAAVERCVKVASRLAAQGRPLRIQNLDSGAEPTVLSNDLLVDVDGTLYGDAALFAEKVFPGLRGPYRIGRVDHLGRFDGLRRSREENLKTLTGLYPPGSPVGVVLEQLVRLGLSVDATLRGCENIPLPSSRTRSAPICCPPASRRWRDIALSSVLASGHASGPILGPEIISQPLRRLRGTRRATPHQDHNPLLDVVLKRSVGQQVRLMRARPELIKFPLLLLDNPCTLDCVFCRAKELEPTTRETASAWLAGNDRVGQTRLGLVGNEPLAHPHIDELIAAARTHGFQRFDVLTTGQPLTDPRRVRQLVEWGVTGFALPLFSIDPRIHDAITRVEGSHRATAAAIGNLRAAGADVHVHANLLRQNLDGADALERHVAEELGLPFCLIPVRPKDANLPYVELAPRYSEVMERLHVRSLVAFPLCVAGRVQRPALAPAEIIADVLKVYVLDQPFLKPPRCAPCSLRGRCAGTFQAYLDLYGDGELRPV